MADDLKTPRGTRDILPEEQKYWRYLNNIVEEKSEAFGCGKIDTPFFEYAEVFNRSLGLSSDIVNKEMFQVGRLSNSSEASDEKNDDKKIMVLRPEMTASIVRAYLEHGMKTWPQPVKLYYNGPCFRYERPQAGRYRVFHQFGVEIIGDKDPLADASVIFLAYRILSHLGLNKNLIVDINSIGDSTCRPKMKKRLSEYFEKFLPSLCADCNHRFTENPLRILDCKNEKCQRIINNAPQIVDLLCSDCKNHFKEVLENLDNMQIAYNLNSRLVRGLDYYTRTVFEFYEENDTSRQSALLGGGRYDDLVKIFGGPNTPAVGFAAGSERIIEKLKTLDINISEPVLTDVSIIQIGDKARKMCLGLVTELENNGIKANCILGKESLKSQLRMAVKMKAKIALIIGQREFLDDSVIIRDLGEGNQETVKRSRLLENLRVKINK